MPSPLFLEHGKEESDLGTWLGVYKANTPGCGTSHNATTFILEETIQPNLHLRLLPECGGASWPEGKYLAGAPEFISEISKSSKSYDLHQKYDLYQQAGVQEYLAILLFEKEIRWHWLKDGAFELMKPGLDRIWRSQVFPGLWLDEPALWTGNLAKMLATLDLGLATKEHQEFVKTLAQKRASRDQG